MKTYFGLTQGVYNGTVLMQQETSSYTTAELRDIVRKQMESLNSTLPDCWTVRYTEFESHVYEHTSEVPILQEKHES